MSQTNDNDKCKEQRKNSIWPSDSFQPREGTISQLSRKTFPIILHPGNLSYYGNSINISAREKNENNIPKKNSARKSVLNIVQEFCENSSLHGLKYVGDPKLTLGERIFWFISVTLAIIFATYYVSNVYNKWKSSPVIISFSPFEADLSTIPFPAVTICNMNQAKKSEAEIILKNGSLIDKKLLADSCNGNSTFDNTENIDFESLRNFLIRVGNPCSEILILCQWGSNMVNCDDIFRNDLTNDGLCCSFNRLPPKMIYRNWEDMNVLNQSYPTNVYDWDAEKGFGDADTRATIPRRPLGAGAHLGLSVVLDAQIDEYYCSSSRSTGFKVILSDPIETPKMADFSFLVGTGFETRIAINPYLKESTDSLRSVPIEKRQCYFANERLLKFYRSYTQRNCLLECQSIYTSKMCGCVPYYLPRSREIVFCGKMEKKCVAKAKQDMEAVIGNRSDCHCLPACFSVEYPYGKSISILSKVVSDDLPNITKQYLEENIAVIHFFFYNSRFMPQLKSELFGFTEILSNTGGLLSLSIGFSFLSFIELLYFIYLRIFCNIIHHTDKNENKSKIIPVNQFSK